MEFPWRNYSHWRTASVYLTFFLCLNLNTFAVEFGFDAWTTADGLPQNSVNGIAQYLWLATFDGLARFDGVRITVFDKGNSPGIINNRFFGIFADREGKVWAFTESGILTVYRAGIFESYETPEGLRELILKISEDENNRLIIATYKRLYYFQDGKFIPLPAEKQINPLNTYSRKPGSVWIVKPESISHRKDGKETFYPLNLRAELAKMLPQLSDSYVNAVFEEITPSSYFEDSHGTLWVGGLPNRLFRLREGSVETFTAADIFGSEKPLNFFPLFEDEKGSIWLSAGFVIFNSDRSETALIKFNGKNFEVGKTDTFFQADWLIVKAIFGLEPSAADC